MKFNNTLSEKAYKQYILIKEHDPIISKKFFRVDILGKGCDGFDYSLSFQSPLKTDQLVNFLYLDNTIQVFLSEFAAEYLKNCLIDYEFDPCNNVDSFRVINLDEDTFKGKFWLK